ncbi:HU family DNA-binding protein [Pelagibacteraceae bacterium]|nr:HU family DNA-binding protein [Pelagibacteraceae bacterium]
MAIVRSQIESQLSKIHTNILRKDINRCCSIIFSEIINALCNDRPVEIRNMGRWVSKPLKSKVGRNPKTGAKVNLPEGRRAVRFKASKILLKKLNENFTESKISDTY